MGDRPPNGPDRARTRADRQREYRHRQRKAEVVAPVVVNHTIIDLLIGLGWIEAEATEDRAALADAIRRVLAEAARYSRADTRLPHCSDPRGSRR